MDFPHLLLQTVCTFCCEYCRTNGKELQLNPPGRFRKVNTATRCPWSCTAVTWVLSRANSPSITAPLWAPHKPCFLKSTAPAQSPVWPPQDSQGTSAPYCSHQDALGPVLARSPHSCGHSVLPSAGSPEAAPAWLRAQLRPAVGQLELASAG